MDSLKTMRDTAARIKQFGNMLTPEAQALTQIATAKVWDDYDAVAVCEGFACYEPDADTLRSAWQHLIDTGLCWKLQGWFGRTAHTLIAAGECTPAKTEKSDA